MYWLTFSFLFISSFDNLSATWKDSELTLVSLLRQGKPSLGTYASRFAFKKEKKKIKPRSWEVAPGWPARKTQGHRKVLGTELWQLPGAQALDSPSRYHLVVIALIYFLPLVVMFVAYSVIGLTLWRRSVPGHQAHGANLRHLQAKKKVNEDPDNYPSVLMSVSMFKLSPLDESH